MPTFFRRFRNDEQGQALVEYTLLVAFVMFTIVGIAIGYHASISGVTRMTNANLAAAASVMP